MQLEHYTFDLGNDSTSNATTPTLDWDSFLSVNFPTFAQNQDQHLRVLDDKFKKLHEKKLKFKHRQPSTLFENAKNKQTQQDARPTRVTINLSELLHFEEQLFYKLPKTSWPISPHIPPLGTFFSLAVHQQNFKYPVHFSQNFVNQSSTTVNAQKHFPPGSFIFVSHDHPRLQDTLQHLFKTARRDHIALFVLTPTATSKTLQKICKTQKNCTIKLNNPMYVYDSTYEHVALNPRLMTIYILGSRGENFQVENNLLGYFQFHSDEIQFPEAPLDFHDASTIDKNEIKNKVLNTVQHLRNLDDAISKNSFKIPFTQTGILAMNQLLNSHSPFTYTGHLPEIFRWRHPEFNKSYNNHEKISRKSFERWRGKLGQKYSITDPHQRCTLCKTLGHDAELCPTRQLKWSDIKSQDPRDRLMFDLILSYPKFQRFEHTFSPDLPTWLLNEAFQQAKIRKQSTEKNFRQLFSLAGYDLSEYLAKYDFRATDTHKGIFWMFAWGVEVKFILFALFGYNDPAEYVFGPAIFFDSNMTEEDACIIRESHEKKAREKKLMRVPLDFPLHILCETVSREGGKNRVVLDNRPHNAFEPISTVKLPDVKETLNFPKNAATLVLDIDSAFDQIPKNINTLNKYCVQSRDPDTNELCRYVITGAPQGCRKSPRI